MKRGIRNADGVITPAARFTLSLLSTITPQKSRGMLQSRAALKPNAERGRRFRWEHGRLKTNDQTRQSSYRNLLGIYESSTSEEG